MPKPRQQTRQDAYTTNLLISLLMRFPEIMAINFDMRRDCCKFTFMLRCKLTQEQFYSFSRILGDSLDAYCELTGENFKVKPAYIRSGKISLLDISVSTTTLSLEIIQLLTGVVSGTFPAVLLRDLETLDCVHEDEMVRQDEMIEYFLSHTMGARQDNLIAFRDAGKVYVYDK